MVLFLSCLHSYQEQKTKRKYILDLIMIRLKDCKESLQFDVYISEPKYKGPDNTPRSLSLTLSSKDTGESIDVDILPAYDALGKGYRLAQGQALSRDGSHPPSHPTGQVIHDAPPNAEVYVRLLDTCSDPGEFSPCFTELQKLFVKHYPAKLKNLLRLVKYWYKEVRRCPAFPTPSRHPAQPALTLISVFSPGAESTVPQCAPAP